MAGIARAHPFERSIKRTAFEAMWHFLRLNGYDLDIEDSQTWAAPVIDLIEHRSTEEDFARALRPYIVPLP
jgi:prophage maintenance system killer protein